MSQTHYLTIVEQEGEISLDEAQIKNELQDMIGELFEQDNEPTYKGESVVHVNSKNEVEFYDGGYEANWAWGKRINLWGYCGQYVLDTIAKHMRSGKFMVVEETEGWPPQVWVVEPGNCHKAKIA